MLDGRTPEQAAKELVSGTKVGDPAFRKSLVDGGQAAVDASTDPMIVMARRIDPIRREQIKWFEDNVQSVQQQSGEQLGKARFAVYGKSTYPDATFTLRLVVRPGEGLSDERNDCAAEDDDVRFVRPCGQLQLQVAV